MSNGKESEKSELAHEIQLTRAGTVEISVLGLGFAVLYALCFHPSMSLSLYSEDFCFIWKAREILENDPLRFLDTSTYFDFFRPLVFVAYYVCFMLFGLNSIFFHLVLMAVHTANALLVYFLIRAISRPVSPWSRALALMFVFYFFSHFRLHQAVFWFSGVKEELSVLFGMAALGSLLRFLRSGRRSWFALCLLLMLLGLCTVESFLGFSLTLCAVAAFWPRSERSRSGKVHAAMLFLPVAAYLFFFMLTRAFSAEEHQYQVFAKSFSLLPGHFMLYLFRAVTPRLLTIDSLQDMIRIFDSLGFLWLAVFFVTGITLTWKARPRGLILAGLVTMLAAPYVVTWNPILEGDRVFYEAVAAICLGAGYGLIRFAEAGAARNRRAMVTALVMALLLAASIRLYRTEITPAYRRIDSWNQNAQKLLKDHFSMHQYPLPVRVYWIGAPFHGDRVLPAPGCLGKMVNLYFAKELVDTYDSAVFRTFSPGQVLFRPSRFYSPPLPSDVIIYDDSWAMKVISYTEAKQVLRELGIKQPNRNHR